MTRFTTPLAAVGLTLAAACATPPEIPPALRAPSGQVPTLELYARGVQVYECAAARDDPRRLEWTFKAPEAELFDRAGRAMGRHYGGPTWEAPDGSAVVARVAARADGPDTDAIPWLRLESTSVRGDGVFAHVRSIQRLQTVGGKAPAQRCERPAALTRVPYSALYRFYAAP